MFFSGTPRGGKDASLGGGGRLSQIGEIYDALLTPWGVSDDETSGVVVMVDVVVVLLLVVGHETVDGRDARSAFLPHQKVLQLINSEVVNGDSCVLLIHIHTHNIRISINRIFYNWYFLYGKKAYIKN